jgi:truncated hemoglobin YjbI
MGGAAKCRELSSAFYSRVDHDPVLRPFFPGKTHKCAVEELSAFLVQFLGGPPEEASRRWWLSLHESHLRFRIGQKERDAWFGLMSKVLDDVAIEEPIRGALRQLFAEASTYVVNSGPAHAVAKCPVPSEIDEQFRRRWEEQRALDDTVAAVRRGNTLHVVAAVESPLLRERFQRDRAIFAHFAGVLIGSGHADMVDYALELVMENPDLAHKKYNGRTLLHAASAAGNLPIVMALLRSGADPHAQDAGGHTPLYSVANESTGGATVIKALIQAGADVEACEGVKRCTPLHMAARRGNVAAAEALLDCGANIEARDSLGETPLRRAVNCVKIDVARLLLARGADPHSVGSKGLTPFTAARTAEMRALLRNQSTSL